MYCSGASVDCTDGVWNGACGIAQAHQNAFMMLPRNMRMLYAHAYQSYVWNKMASERVRRFGHTNAVEGDLVLVTADDHAAQAAVGDKRKQVRPSALSIRQGSTRTCGTRKELAG
eukprot:8244471-Pyramimonas_sp.AAC.4